MEERVHSAAISGNVTLLRELLFVSQKQVTEVYMYEHNTFCIAISHGHYEIVRDLLEYGFKIKNSNALFIAARNGNVEIVELLVSKGVETEIVDSVGDTPLLIAVREGHTGVVKELLQYGLDVKQQDSYRNTLLGIASEKGYASIVEILLSVGYNKDYIDESGWSPLHRACLNGQVEVVRVLLQHRCDITRVSDNKFYQTAMDIVSSLGYSEVVYELIVNGYPYCNQVYHLNGALKVSCRAGHIHVVRILISAGCRHVPKNVRSITETAIYYACMNSHATIVRYLLSHGIDEYKTLKESESILFDTIIAGHINVVRVLLDANFFENIPRRGGFNLLHKACTVNCVEIAVMVLHRTNIDINELTTTTKATPLFIACERGHVRVVRMLLKHRADPEITNNSNLTAFSIAVLNNNTSVVRELLGKCDLPTSFVLPELPANFTYNTKNAIKQHLQNLFIFFVVSISSHEKSQSGITLINIDIIRGIFEFLCAGL